MGLQKPTAGRWREPVSQNSMSLVDNITAVSSTVAIAHLAEMHSSLELFFHKYISTWTVYKTVHSLHAQIYAI